MKLVAGKIGLMFLLAVLLSSCQKEYVSPPNNRVASKTNCNKQESDSGITYKTSDDDTFDSESTSFSSSDVVGVTSERKSNFLDKMEAIIRNKSRNYGIDGVVGGGDDDHGRGIVGGGDDDHGRGDKKTKRRTR